MAVAAGASATQMSFTSPVQSVFSSLINSNKVVDAGTLSAGNSLSFIISKDAGSEGGKNVSWSSFSAESAFLPSGWTAKESKSGNNLIVTLQSTSAVPASDVLLKFKASNVVGAIQTASFKLKVVAPVTSAKPSASPSAAVATALPSSGTTGASGFIPEGHDLLLYSFALVLILFIAVGGVSFLRKKRANSIPKERPLPLQIQSSKPPASSYSALPSSPLGLRAQKKGFLGGLFSKGRAQVPVEEKTSKQVVAASSKEVIGEVDSALASLKPKRDWDLQEKKKK